MNANSLHKKHCYLKIFVEKLLEKGLYFSAICIQEARISSDTNTKSLDLPGYTLHPKTSTHFHTGGLATYIHNSFSAQEREKLDYSTETSEALFLDVFGKSISGKVTIGNVYRPGRNNNNLQSIRRFINDIKPSLNTLNRENSYSFIAADFNINLLKLHNQEGVADFFDFICSKDFLPMITIPTRFDEQTCSLIDNILVNPPANLGILDTNKITSHVLKQ